MKKCKNAPVEMVDYPLDMEHQISSMEGLDVKFVTGRCWDVELEWNVPGQGKGSQKFRVGQGRKDFPKK
jgi:hypothetical protein